MANVISENTWDLFQNKRLQKGSILIDLSACKTKTDILKKIGHILKGQDSILIRGNSLDALMDVMSDWFCENWEQKHVIYIAGINHLFNMDHALATKVIECFNDAYV